MILIDDIVTVDEEFLRMIENDAGLPDINVKFKVDSFQSNNVALLIKLDDPSYKIYIPREELRK